MKWQEAFVADVSVGPLNRKSPGEI